MAEERTTYEESTQDQELSSWRGEALARVREIIRRADPDVVEEMKWARASKSMSGVPVWSNDGFICTIEP